MVEVVVVVVVVVGGGGGGSSGEVSWFWREDLNVIPTYTIS